MVIVLTSGKTLRRVELGDVSQIIVLSDQGVPVALAREMENGVIVASHAAEPDFAKMCSAAGVKAETAQVTTVR